MAKLLRYAPDIYARYGGVPVPRVPDAAQRPQRVYARLRRAMAVRRRPGTHGCGRKAGSRVCSAPFRALMLPAAGDTRYLFLRKPVRPALLDRSLERRPGVHPRQPSGEARIRPELV